jgi:hypothetical protein
VALLPVGTRVYVFASIAGTTTAKGTQTVYPADGRVLFIVARDSSGSWRIARSVFFGSDKWDDVRWQATVGGARVARERGQRDEAENLCFRAYQHVGAATLQNLYEYAATLAPLKQTDAGVVDEHAERLLMSRQGGPGTQFLGFVPADEIGRYAAVLDELGRNAEGMSMRRLAVAARTDQLVQVVRMREQAQGEDTRGKCWLDQ